MRFEKIISRYLYSLKCFLMNPTEKLETLKKCIELGIEQRSKQRIDFQTNKLNKLNKLKKLNHLNKLNNVMTLTQYPHLTLSNKAINIPEHRSHKRCPPEPFSNPGCHHSRSDALVHVSPVHRQPMPRSHPWLWSNKSKSISLHTIPYISQTSFFTTFPKTTISSITYNLFNFFMMLKWSTSTTSL